MFTTPILPELGTRITGGLRKPTARRLRRAFTLVEMLTVVVIIAILAGLITAAAARARVRAKIAAIGVEIKQMDMACHAFKEKFGEYPPDFTDTAAVTRCVQRIFPRYNAANWASDLSTAGVTQRNAKSAIIVFLGGIPEKDATTGVVTMTGFSADPLRPFASRSVVPGRIGPFFDFDPERLSFASGLLQYFGPYVDPKKASGCYIYFRAGSGGYVSSFAHVKPKKDSRTGGWANPNSFQILCGGFDRIHGSGQDFPTGSDYDAGQYDDMANFCEGTFEDNMP